jgi:hypothetical protein
LEFDLPAGRQVLQVTKKPPLFKKITSSLRSGGRILHKSFRPEKRIE